MGRNRQADVVGRCPRDHAPRDPPRHDAPRPHGAGRLRADQDQDRVDPVSRDHFARLAARPPSLTIEAAVLARRAVKPYPGRPVHHLAVNPDVDAPRPRITRERDIAGADITPPVPPAESGALNGWARPGVPDNLRPPPSAFASGKFAREKADASSDRGT